MNKKLILALGVVGLCSSAQAITRKKIFRRQHQEMQRQEMQRQEAERRKGLEIDNLRALLRADATNKAAYENAIGGLQQTFEQRSRAAHSAIETKKGQVAESTRMVRIYEENLRLDRYSDDDERDADQDRVTHYRGNAELRNREISELEAGLMADQEHIDNLRQSMENLQRSIDAHEARIRDLL